jgi:hypothetical protein
MLHYKLSFSPSFYFLRNTSDILARHVSYKPITKWGREKESMWNGPASLGACSFGWWLMAGAGLF